MTKTILALFVFASFLSAEGQTLVQHYTKENPYLLVEKEEDLPDTLIQHSGFWKTDKVYGEMAYKVGLHINTGEPIQMRTNLKLGDTNTSHVIGAHGAGTEVYYRGQWQGDGGNSYPNLVLSKGARFIITPEAHIDYVLQGSFYTRQLWAYGDGTGTIEIQEGFLADRTLDGTVEDAMGTIRLNGVNLVTHHSRNLPFNTRPDGRGGVYPNGHIVWEGQPGSVWTVSTSPQIYRAQLDFVSDGTIDCQQSLVHAGHKRVTSSKMIGGVFMSTGAFRTCKPGVTITKTGPGMLALEGQQGYYPDSTLKVTHGMLRMTTNPADGYRYNPKTGPYLTIKADQKSVVHLASEVTELQAIEMGGHSELHSFTDSTFKLKESLVIGPRATFHANAKIEGDVHCLGHWNASSRQKTTIDGTLEVNGRLSVSGDRRLIRSSPRRLVLIEAKTIKGNFVNHPHGSKVTLIPEVLHANIDYQENSIALVDFSYTPKPKKKKKKK